MASPVTDWLLRGDPAVRWQVMRDLLDRPRSAYEKEQQRVAKQGWGKRLLDLQAADGRWTVERGPKGYRGLYTPKWTSTTYTLLELRGLGLPSRQPQALTGCEALVAGSQWLDDGSLAPWASPRSDTCVCAMILGVLEWFDFEAPGRRKGLLEYLLRRQKSDGGWNCAEKSEVSSVHTTLSTLEALQLCRTKALSGSGARRRAIDRAMKRGHEYLLERHLFRSLRTGNVIRPSFQLFSFPPRWYYDVLRALDHLRDTGGRPDPRAAEAIELVRSKRLKDGSWPLQNKHPGETHFDMEKTGQPSRWNTLRALRVLRWWGDPKARDAE